LYILNKSQKISLFYLKYSIWIHGDLILYVKILINRRIQNIYIVGEIKMRNNNLLLIMLIALGVAPKVFGLSLTQAVSFEDDKLGSYTKDDFIKDWIISPTTSSGQKDGRLIIQNDSNTTNNKVMQVTYLATR
jgi:hypothetical protein